jgi:hypothetical protein
VLARNHIAGVALVVGMIPASWAAQRPVLKSLTACPNVNDFTNWFEAMEKGNSSRAFELIDGKGCIEVNKGAKQFPGECGGAADTAEGSDGNIYGRCSNGETFLVEGGLAMRRSALAKLGIRSLCPSR